VSHTAYERCSCPDEEHCGLRMLMNDVRNAIANILDRFTLEDTVSMTLRKIRRNKPEIPFIEGLLGRPIMENPGGLNGSGRAARAASKAKAKNEPRKPASPKPRAKAGAPKSKNRTARVR